MSRLPRLPLERDPAGTARIGPVAATMLAEATRQQAEQYGYGFGVYGKGPLRGHGHGGGAPGMNGDLMIYPQLGYVLVSLANLDPPAASRVVDFYALRMPAK